MFEEARYFQASHPGLNSVTVPTIVSGSALKLSEPTALVVNSNSLERRNVMLDAPLRILVIAHPLCDFSASAVQDIQGNSSIADVFADHAVWLAPPDRQLHLEIFREWNSAHPLEPILLTYRASEWPSVENWNVPTFYFFKDGHLVTWCEGWPKDGNWIRLTEALELIGAIHDESPAIPFAE